MPRQTILQGGSLAYRTTLLPLDRAAAFAKMIDANASRFADVEIIRSDRARTEKYFVQFRPVNRERQQDMYTREWDKNQKRADEQGQDFIYFLNTDNPTVTFVFNPHSGETWEMFGGHCQCPHKQFRLNAASLSCKHELEADRRRAAGIYPDADKKTQTVPTETREQFKARIAAMIAEDFPDA